MPSELAKPLVVVKLTGRPEPTAWGEKLPFGTICGEFSSPNGGWVHDVAFSPSGNILAYTGELLSAGRRVS